ncbi:hypothetical protein [Flavobacterium sp.]|uniref:hypothetical protein n=1 Tax=Flavobacterium sp. TaxID=239 RepID=UPI00260765AC|nr:hypothetical protein [Flavobacterium sp.]
MKRIITLFAIIGLVAFSGCTNEDNVDSDTIAEVIEINGVNFNSSNGFRIRYDLKPEIYPQDMVLVYRLVAVENGVKVWGTLPETAFDNNGAYDFSYNFEFSKYDVDIFIQGFDLGSIISNLRLNQTFRIVIVPGYFSKTLDTNNYISVMKALNLKENQVQQIRL